MRSGIISIRVSALLMAAAMTGCVVVADAGTYDHGSGYGAAYRGGAYSGTTVYQYNDFHRAYPYRQPGSHPPSRRSGSGHRPVAPEANRHDTGRVASDLRNWRDGDGAFRRKQRELGGVGLEERQRRDRQERLIEQRQDRTDRAINRRASGQLDIPGRPDPGISEKFDQDVRRRLQRSNQAERRAQRRAGEVRRQLRAERQAESE